LGHIDASPASLANQRKIGGNHGLIAADPGNLRDFEAGGIGLPGQIVHLRADPSWAFVTSRRHEAGPAIETMG
jgi:hypothetical protein